MIKSPPRYELINEELDELKTAIEKGILRRLQTP